MHFNGKDFLETHKLLTLIIFYLTYLIVSEPNTKKFVSKMLIFAV